MKKWLVIFFISLSNSCLANDTNLPSYPFLKRLKLVHAATTTLAKDTLASIVFKRNSLDDIWGAAESLNIFREPKPSLETKTQLLKYDMQMLEKSIGLLLYLNNK